MTDDRDLRERFDGLRREDSRDAEPAPRVLARARALREESSRSSRAWRAWAPGAAVAALAALVWLALPAPAPAPAAGTDALRLAEIDFDALGSLRTPTDSLLELGRLKMLGRRAPELLPIPALPARPPVRESRARRRILS